jgi:hypothetical protein
MDSNAMENMAQQIKELLLLVEACQEYLDAHKGKNPCIWSTYTDDGVKVYRRFRLACERVCAK